LNRRSKSAKPSNCPAIRAKRREDISRIYEMSLLFDKQPNSETAFGREERFDERGGQVREPSA
jgi:hypothetical protein